MKKSLFILPVAALAMAACSSDTVTENATQIKLSNADQLTMVPVVQGSTTRATAKTTATLNEFKVRITGKFQKGEENANLWDEGLEQTVKKSGSAWVFDGLADGESYWWADKSTSATFTAWSPADETQSITVADEIANQQDILVAYNAGAREDFDAGVPLNFQHVMSQIIVKALNKNTGDITVKVGGMKICHLQNTGTLAYPTSSTAAATFDWDTTDYEPWSGVSGSATYKNGSETTKTASVTSPRTLTASAQNLADPMLLMPQALQTADLTSESTPGGNYLAILVQVTGKSVGYRDADGYYYTTGGKKIKFTARRDGATTGEMDTYTKAQVDLMKVGTAPTGMTDEDNNAVTAGANQVKMDTETIYPKQGFGTKSDRWAYVGVDLGGLTWKPGYKYTYTLNFSKDGIGKSIADQPSDKSDIPAAENFPYGKNFETGEENDPGEDIVDNPVQLFFTVTVDEWIDADPIPHDM